MMTMECSYEDLGFCYVVTTALVPVGSVPKNGKFIYNSYIIRRRAGEILPATILSSNIFSFPLWTPTPCFDWGSSSSSYFSRSRLVLRYMTARARPILPLADPSCQEPIWETVAGCTFHNADPQKPYTHAYTDAAYPISCCIPNTPMHTLYAKAHWGPLGSLLQSAMADCIHICIREIILAPLSRSRRRIQVSIGKLHHTWAAQTTFGPEAHFFSFWEYIWTSLHDF